MDTKSTRLPPITTTSPVKPAKIPRPLNSFMIFRLEKQREILDRCPGANHRDISKIISKWWKELSSEDKQKYITEADKLKIEHRRLYPNYKYCPQKKTRKTRAYKKRAENEFSARDFESKQNLYALYKGENKRQRSKDSYDSEPPSTCQKLSLDTTDTTAALCPPCYSVSPASLQLSSSEGNHAAKVNSTSYTTHQSIPLFPATAYYGSPIASVTYSVPSQQFACSSSPVSTSDTSSSTTSDDSHTEPLVNYNIYNDYYAPPPTSAEAVHSAYPYGMSGNVPTLHYVAPSHHYPPPAAHYYTNAANSSIDYSGCLHPYGSKNHSHDVAVPPNLLTLPFYYQS